MQRCDQFRPPPPPRLDHARYAADFNEVKRLGVRNSAARTVYETETAHFWSDFTSTVTPPGHWNQITRVIANDRALKLSEKARLLALLNLVLADAGIVAWDAKYTFNFWRPITAIRNGDADRNPDTTKDQDWQPLLVSPAFPEYVSGHSTFSGAAAAVLAHFFGGDEVTFRITSDSLPGVVREYHSLVKTAEEIGHSRILGGIHFTSSDKAGRASGAALGAYVCRRFLIASEPGSNRNQHAQLGPGPGSPRLASFPPLKVPGFWRSVEVGSESAFANRFARSE
jgi:membrane-associated phospholipid phosphatase